MSSVASPASRKTSHNQEPRSSSTFTSGDQASVSVAGARQSPEFGNRIANFDLVSEGLCGKLA